MMMIWTMFFSLSLWILQDNRGDCYLLLLLKVYQCPFSPAQIFNENTKTIHFLTLWSVCIWTITSSHFVPQMKPKPFCTSAQLCLHCADHYHLMPYTGLCCVYICAAPSSQCRRLTENYIHINYHSEEITPIITVLRGSIFCVRCSLKSNLNTHQTSLYRPELQNYKTHITDV